MSDLSSDGKALVQAAKRADRPSDADRKRVLAALQARLGDAAVFAPGQVRAPSAGGGAAEADASRVPFVKWAWVGSAVLVAGALWLVPRSSGQGVKMAPAPSASARESALKAASVIRADAPPTAVVSGSATVAPSANPSVATSASSPQKAAARSRDGLAEEVALLSRAETELHAGRAAKALLAIAEHQRKFPRGVLAEERTAARIQALCALGRRDEANAQLGQLLRLSPNSAHEERARQACRD